MYWEGELAYGVAKIYYLRIFDDSNEIYTETGECYSHQERKCSEEIVSGEAQKANLADKQFKGTFTNIL